MNSWSLSNLSDDGVVAGLRSHAASERSLSAHVLAHIAETDSRKLYLPAAYPSMFAYCVGELHYSEDAAYKRVRAARAARDFPSIFDRIADGRLHLSGLVLLAPHLTRENADELLDASTHRTKAQIEQLLAERFPQPDLATFIQPLPPTAGWEPPDLRGLCESGEQLAPGRVGITVSHQVASPVAPPARVAPLAPERFELRGTMDQAMHDDLCAVRELLGPGAGDAMAVLGRAVRLMRRHLERRRFAATERPRRQRSRAEGRYVPAEVRREVWQRDGGRCTFVSESGRRCESRTGLEFDHSTPVARGGETTVANLRLRCRAHNQHAADCAFGAGFMARKRREARRPASRAYDPAHARRESLERERAAAEAEGARDADVIPWLRQLGFRADEARRAAAECDTPAGAPLEDRVRQAIRFLAPRCSHVAAPVAQAPA